MKLNMKKKLFFVGMFAVILMFGFIITACGEIIHDDISFRGTWTGSVLADHDDDDSTSYVAVDQTAVFQDASFVVTVMYNDAPVNHLGYSGNYKVTGTGRADLYNIVGGVSQNSGTARVIFGRLELKIGFNHIFEDKVIH
jgi:hypothetical protein